MSDTNPPSPGTIRGDYINPALRSSPQTSPASSPKASPSPSPSSSSSSSSSLPKQNTEPSVGPPSTGNRKRKASWSLFNLLPKKFRPAEEEEEEDTDVVNLVLKNNIEGLKKVEERQTEMVPIEEREEGETSEEERKELAQNNPLYVAAMVNRVEAAKLLLALGYRMAEDRTMIKKSDPYNRELTPLGIAFQKKNGVYQLFESRIKESEDQFNDRKSKKLRRNLSAKFRKSYSLKVVAENPAGEKTNSDCLVNMVLENDVEGLRAKSIERPKEVVLEEEGAATSIEEREERANENPLFVAAKIGRKEAAEYLVEQGYKMTDDRTRKVVDDMRMVELTPLGASFDNNFGVTDIFLNRIIEIEAFVGPDREAPKKGESKKGEKEKE